MTTRLVWRKTATKTIRSYSTKTPIININNYTKSIDIRLDATENNNQTNFRCSTRWLRDNCQCYQCLHPSNKQKLHSSADFPDNQISSAKINNNALQVEFNTGHVSRFNLDWLQRYHDESITPSPKFTLELDQEKWDGKIMSQKHKRVSFKSYMDNERTVYDVLRNLYCYGLVFLEGCPTENTGAVLESIAERIGFIKNTFYGKLWDVRSIPNATNIAYTSLDLGLHMDLLYFADPPGLQFLQCLANGVTGGASYFSDSFYAAEQLYNSNRAAWYILNQTPVTFHYDHDDHPRYYRHRTLVTKMNGDDVNNLGNVMPDLSYVNYSPPFQGPIKLYRRADRLSEIAETFKSLGGKLDDAKDEHLSVVNAFYDAFGKFSNYVNDKSGHYELTLKPGECVIFDNRRILHARREFDASSGERWLKGTYVDEGTWKDKLLRYQKTIK